jgi:hypothetical protein
MANRMLFPHAFGLKTPAPLWTTPALDRCLLLAFIYLIATIFLIWAISGHVGPAEEALALKPNLPGWSRALAAAARIFYRCSLAWFLTNGAQRRRLADRPCCCHRHLHFRRRCRDFPPRLI